MKMVPGNVEEKVPTRPDFDHYRIWFEDFIARWKNMYPNFRVINATEGGAKIKGTEISTLKEAIEKECKIEADVSANIVIAQMLFLEAEDPSKDIHLYINSPGGSVSAGFAIYDTMQYIKCDVSTMCMGLAASMGAFLLAGGAKGKRLALPNSEIMIHQPSGGAKGQETEIRIVAENILKTRNRLNEILAANTGKSVEEISRDTERDNYMTAQEAVAYGLIDSVVEKR